MKKKVRRMRASRQMVEKYIWQRLGKGQIQVERKVDLEANRRTLEFVRSKGLVSSKDVAKEFKINLDSACHRLSRLKKSGFLSTRILKNRKVFFPTKRGFERLPREKGQKPQIIEKIKEVEKEVLKINETKYLGEI